MQLTKHCFTEVTSQNYCSRILYFEFKVVSYLSWWVSCVSGNNWKASFLWIWPGASWEVMLCLRAYVIRAGWLGLLHTLVVG